MRPGQKLSATSLILRHKEVKMPSSTPKQARVMSAVAHGWKPEGLNIPVSVAKEFHQADKGHKYGAKGRAFGGVAPMMGQAFNPMMPNSMPGTNPATEMNNNPAMQPMSQPPINGQTAGVAPPAMMAAPNGLNAGMLGLNAGVLGLAGARPFASGGVASLPLPIDHTNTFKGPIVSRVPGRTDNHETKVPSGSFVIPADIVSAHGQGNTLAGMDTLQKLFRMGPHANASSIPKTINAIHKRAKGGGTERHMGQPVKVLLAGGEIVVPPENVHETMCRITGKKLTLDQSHQALDAWVISQRKKLVKTLKKLPGPAKD
jgi:hypothetical protein